MARIALTVAGAVAFGAAEYFTGGLFSLVGPQAMGMAIGLGAAAGSMVGGILFHPKLPQQPIDQTVGGSTNGAPIPFGYGTMRVPGNVIWASSPPITQHKKKSSGSAKGMGGGGTTYTYTATLAVAFGEGPGKITRIWADSKIIYDNRGASINNRGTWDASKSYNINDVVKYTNQNYICNVANTNQNPSTQSLYWTVYLLPANGKSSKYKIPPTVYPGDENQQPDPTIQAAQGVANTPAYRGLMYAVWNNLSLDDFGNRIPQFRAEVSMLSQAQYPYSQVALTQPTVYPGSGAQPATPAYALIDSARQYTFLIDATGQCLWRINRITNVVESTQTNFTLGSSGLVSFNVAGRNCCLDNDGFIWGWTSNPTYELLKIDPFSWSVIGVVPLPAGTYGEPLGMNAYTGADGTSYIVMLGEPAGAAPTLTVVNSHSLAVVGTYPFGTNLFESNFPVMDAIGNVYVLTRATSGYAWTVWQVYMPGGVNTFAGNVYNTVNSWSFTGNATIGQGKHCLYNAADNTLLILTTTGGLIRFDIKTGAILSQAGGTGSELYDYVHGTGVINMLVSDMQVAAHNGVVPGDGLVRLRSYSNSAILNVISASTLSIVETINVTSFAPFSGGISNYTCTFDADTNSLEIAQPATGANYYRLNFDRGSIGGNTVDGIVTDICSRAGLDSTKIDVSALTSSTCWGYVVPRPEQAKGPLGVLASAFFFDVVESDFKLKFVPRGGSPGTTVAENDLGLVADKKKIEESIGQQVELPQAITVMYNDKDMDYQQNKQLKGRRTRVIKTKNQEIIQLPLALDKTTARQIAEKALYLRWSESKSYQFNLWKSIYLPLDPTDVITFTYEGMSFQMRIVDATMGQGFTVALQGVSEDARNYISSIAGGSTGFVPQYIPFIGTTVLFMYDLPLLQDTDAPPTGSTGYYFAGGSPLPNWPGFVLYKSSDNENYQQEAFSVDEVSYGQCLTTLAAPVSPYSWDMVNTLTVRMVQGTLSSSTMLNVLNGANGLIVGNEVIQFVTATLNADGSYTLSQLLRGRRGTEWACSGHGSGEYAVVPGVGLHRENVPTSLVGLLRYIKAVTLGEDISTVSPRQVTLTGADLKPYAVAHLGGSRDGSGNFSIAWTRRTRIGGQWQSGANSADVPLAEATESYDVEICDSTGNVKRTYSAINTPSLYYSSTVGTTDFGAPPASLRVRVYQNSAQVGRGFVAENLSVGVGLPPVGGGVDASSINGVPILGTPIIGQTLIYNGTDLVWQAAVPRQNISKTTASLAAGASETGAITIARSFGLLQITTNKPCRVELYSTAAHRDADAGRAVGTQPTSGSAHGLIADVVMDTAMTWDLSPEAFGANLDSPVSNQIYYRITNTDTTTGTVSVTLVCDLLEQA